MLKTSLIQALNARETQFLLALLLRRLVIHNLRFHKKEFAWVELPKIYIIRSSRVGPSFVYKIVTMPPIPPSMQLARVKVVRVLGKNRTPAALVDCKDRVSVYGSGCMHHQFEA